MKMNDLNIQEGNELLAQLLGWEKEIEGVEGVWYENIDCARYVAYSINSNYPYKTLPFHRDMNWLFKVVDKIETINNGWDGRRGDGTTPLRVFCEKTDDGKFKAYILFNQAALYKVIGESRPDVVWECSVQFAKNYLKDSK